MGWRMGRDSTERYSFMWLHRSRLGYSEYGHFDLFHSTIIMFSQVETKTQVERR